ncbi:hypothetical protein AAJL62_10140, partial [Staphylococcus hominis]|uniref:hypothetical protein n=1 Tax=Staphylococcus hominis TaxID=1290 RepID=UPI0031BADC70
RKVTAQRAENNQKNYKKDNFYIISIEIVFFHLSRYFMSRTLFYFIFWYITIKEEKLWILKQLKII